MGVKVTGIVEVESMIYRLDTTNRRRVVGKLFDVADDIASLARKMAPVDTGGLEQAIKVRPENRARERDALGRFTRTEIEVYVDMDAVNSNGVAIGEYAYYAHELTEPAGPNQLGDASRRKQGNQSVQVGGGFLDRATFVVDAAIETMLIEAFDDVL